MNATPAPSRRDFLKVGGVTVAAMIGQSLLPGSARAADTAAPEAPATTALPASTAMPTRNLGRTGFRVSLFGLGGQAAIERGNNDAVAVPIIERALDLGVNYIDTSSIYGGPERWSERYIGQVMKRRRGEAFLASKTRERTRDGSFRMIEESFKLLNTDHLDLWQLHDVGTMRDVDEICAKGGAMEAMLQAKEQKMVRFIGVTGHYRPEPLMELLRRFPFDTVLMALNAADRYHHGFAQELLPFAIEQQLGIVAMKLTSRGRLLSSWTPPPIEQQKRSWESAGSLATSPGTLNLREARYYAYTLPISTAIVGVDSIAQLEENVQLTREFTPLSEKQMLAIAERAGPVAKQAMFFRLMQRS